MRLILLTLGLCLLAPSAEAARPPDFRQHCRYVLHGMSAMDSRGAVFKQCWAVQPRQVTGARRHHRHAGARVAARRHGGAQPGDPIGQVVEHPAGCPWHAFCGCGAAVEVFGRPIRELWLAANWLRFPRAEPAPGMAAVRSHHVMVIREYLGDGRALVFDANSGRHLTRVHVRSLAGYRIVNPRS